MAHPVAVLMSCKKAFTPAVLAKHFNLSATRANVFKVSTKHVSCGLTILYMYSATTMDMSAGTCGARARVCASQQAGSALSHVNPEVHFPFTWRSSHHPLERVLTLPYDTFVLHQKVTILSCCNVLALIHLPFAWCHFFFPTLHSTLPPF